LRRNDAKRCVSKYIYGYTSNIGFSPLRYAGKNYMLGILGASDLMLPDMWLNREHSVFTELKTTIEN
jgi:hypothetical protein